MTDPSESLTALEAEIEAFVGNSAVLVSRISKVDVPLGAVIIGFGVSVSTLTPGSLTTTTVENRLLSSDDSST